MTQKFRIKHIERCKCECHNPMSKWEQCSMCEHHHLLLPQPPHWEELQKAVEVWFAEGRTEEQIFGVQNFLTGKGGTAIRTLLDKTREEEKKALLATLKAKIEKEKTFQARTDYIYKHPDYVQALSDILKLLKTTE